MCLILKKTNILQKKPLDFSQRLFISIKTTTLQFNYPLYKGFICFDKWLKAIIESLKM